MIGSLSYQVHPGAEFSSVGAVTLGDNWVANHLFTVACSIVAGKHPVLLALQSFTRRWVLAAVSSEREKTGMWVECETQEECSYWAIGQIAPNNYVETMINEYI